MCFLLTFRLQENTASKEATTRYTWMEYDGKLDLFKNANENHTG